MTVIDMRLSALKESLSLSLMDTANLFGDKDWPELLQDAADDLARVKRRIRSGTLTLVCGQTDYAAPSDLIGLRFHRWGYAERQTRLPWERGYPRDLPRVTVMDGQPKTLRLSFAPNAMMLALLGQEMVIDYYTGHTLSDTEGETTVPPEQRDLLLLRAQAEAMKWLAQRNVNYTTSVQQAVAGTPKNGVPAALYQQLMADFERRAAC